METKTKQEYLFSYPTKKILSKKSEKKGHYILKRGIFQQEDTILNINALNIGAPSSYKKHF
jgi:hypothetical protein